MNIVSIYDNGGISFDRYTVVFDEPFNVSGDLLTCLGLSNNPTSAQGFSQFSGCKNGDHLGKRIEFNELPENIQKHIKQRIF